MSQYDIVGHTNILADIMTSLHISHDVNLIISHILVLSNVIMSRPTLD